jgi:lysophospholipase L1-like esterase
MLRILPTILVVAVGMAGCASTPPSPLDGLPDDVRMLALGDSYAAGTAIGVDEAWPAQLAVALTAERRVERSVVASDGWNTKRLSREIARAGLGAPFDLIVLEIGANDVVLNFGEENFMEGLELLALDIDALAGPDAIVVVLSIPDFRVSPWGRERLDRGYDIEGFNAILSSFASDVGASYVDITAACAEALDDPSLIAPDELHFAPAMHATWVERVLASTAPTAEGSVEDRARFGGAHELRVFAEGTSGIPGGDR